MNSFTVVLFCVRLECLVCKTDIDFWGVTCAL